MKKAIQIIKKYQNPYPKDIFLWDNKTDMKITRGRFNEFIHLVVENVKHDLIRNLIDEMENPNYEPKGAKTNKDLQVMPSASPKEATQTSLNTDIKLNKYSSGQWNGVKGIYFVPLWSGLTTHTFIIKREE